MTKHHEVRIPGLPVDSDVTAEDVAAAAPGHAAVTLRHLAVVMLGGFIGGLTRYETVKHWASGAGTFPWSTFFVNTAGAVILGALVILVLDVLAPSTYTRPLLGAGFCGALTTFSSVAVQVDQLIAHGHAALGFGYLAASLGAGVVAVATGAYAARLLPPSAGRRAHLAGAG